MMTTRKIIPYHLILITGLSLLRKTNILLCKTGKVYILHARHIFPFVVYILFFFECKINTTSDDEVDDGTYDDSFDESEFDE